jgi:hypothetical protein
VKEVYRSSDTAMIGLFQSILDGAGIPYFVRNSTTQQSIVGGLATALFPLPEFWPALCVLNDEDYPHAMELLRAARDTTPVEQADWQCAKCGETVPGNFTSCWNCEEPQPPPP